MTAPRRAPRTVGLSGNLTNPSRTRWLAEHLVAEVARASGGHGTVYGVLEDCPGLGSTFDRKQAPPALEAVLEAIENCDVLVAVTPVYKGGYAGLFKHLIDLVDMKKLAERPVIVAATGYTERHASVIDFQMRPLFAFFGALVMPSGIFAGKTDIDDEHRMVPSLQAAVDAAVRQAAAAAQTRKAT